MNQLTRNAILALFGFVAVFGTLFGFFSTGLTGSIQMLSIDAWGGLQGSEAYAVCLVILIFSLATGKMRLPVSKAPPETWPLATIR